MIAEMLMACLHRYGLMKEMDICIMSMNMSMMV